MIQERILELTEYGLVTGLVEPEDRRFTINRLLELFHLDELEDEVAAAYAKRTPMTQESAEAALEDILNEMLDYAAEDGLMPEDTITYRDLFDTKIMSMLMPRPSEVITKFRGLYNHQSAQAATDYFYKLSCDSNYIRRYRIKKDLNGLQIPSLVPWISRSIYQNRKKIRKQSLQQNLQNRAVTRNAYSARKMRDTQDV